MGASVSVSNPVLSCVLMRDGEPPVHLRLVLGTDDVIVERVRQDDDAIVSMPVRDEDLATVLRQLPG